MNPASEQHIGCIPKPGCIILRRADWTCQVAGGRDNLLVSVAQPQEAIQWASRAMDLAPLRLVTFFRCKIDVEPRLKRYECLIPNITTD